ncbi:LysM domain-containing protein [Planctomicrobium piriforme]|uniref:LysM domain-containing protein n=1 Tax=Planctomicrobium piriforme TaxID=1576369 RepID=A0A1I3P755_9PLAN|nr:LysM domain-containing protein [Planctomicrobium piriforme]
MILHQKFSDKDLGWAHWQKHTLKEVVLGQSPTPPNAPAANSNTKAPVTGSSVPPLWARSQTAETAPPRKAATTTARKDAGIQLVGHVYTENDLPNVEPTPAPAIRQTANRPAAPGLLPMNSAREVDESPRSLFAGADDLPAANSPPSRPTAPMAVAPAQSENELPSADPFGGMPTNAPQPIRRSGIQQTGGTEQPGFPEPEIMSLEPMAGAKTAPATRSTPPERLDGSFDLAPTPARPQQPPVQQQHVHQQQPIMSLDDIPTAPPSMPQHQQNTFAPPPRQPAPQNFTEPSFSSPAPKPAARQMLPPVQSQPVAVTPKEEIPSDDVYQVQSGDNYWTISRRFYGSARFFGALAEHNKNRIPDPSKMKPGMYVIVPHIEALHQAYPQLTGGGARDPGEDQPPGFFIDDNGQPGYRIGKGDTLTDIAEKHLGRSSRWVQIYGMNKDRIPDGKTLKIGSVLRLPADAAQVMLAPAEADIR